MDGDEKLPAGVPQDDEQWEQYQVREFEEGLVRIEQDGMQFVRFHNCFSDQNCVVLANSLLRTKNNTLIGFQVTYDEEYEGQKITMKSIDALRQIVSSCKNSLKILG